jgi:hypothetical protein
MQTLADRERAIGSADLDTISARDALAGSLAAAGRVSALPARSRRDQDWARPLGVAPSIRTLP